MGLLGIFVVLVELPCTGAPYFAILALLAKGMYADAVPYLLLYNFIFVAPLLAVIAIAYFGKTESMERWRAEHRGAMRLFTGLFLVALGAYMIYSLYLSLIRCPKEISLCFNRWPYQRQRGLWRVKGMTSYFIEIPPKDIGDGFVPKTENWKDDVAWADVVRRRTRSGKKRAAESRASTLSAAPRTRTNEDDRAFGQEELRRRVSPYFRTGISSFDEAIQFVKKSAAIRDKTFGRGAERQAISFTGRRGRA